MIGITGGGSIYQIYVDSYFLFHFYVNLWILFLCRFFLHSNISGWRIFLTSCLAALGESALLCLPIGSGAEKMSIGFLGGTIFILWFLFRPKTYSAFCKILLSAYGTAILLGGSLLLIQRFLPDFLGNFFWISCLGGGIMTFTAGILKRIYSEKTEHLVEVELFFFDGKKKRIKALVDTGNSLVEPISRKPVSVVEREAVKEYLDSLSHNKYRIIPFCSVGNSRGLMDGFFIPKIKIYGRSFQWEKEDIIIALAEDKISFGKKYQMILHPKLLENQEEYV